MRDLTTPELAYLQARTGIVAEVLIWITARNRSTGLTEALGLWTGADQQTFTINGVPRVYFGTGAILGADQISMQPGLGVKLHRLRLASASPEVLTLVQAYDLAFAPVEVRRAFFDPQWGTLVAEPRVVWKGSIDRAPLPTPEKGGTADMEVTLSSMARALTKGLTITKSDAVQQLRGGDRFRRYQDVTGKVSVSWGEARS